MGSGVKKKHSTYDEPLSKIRGHKNQGTQYH